MSHRTLAALLVTALLAICADGATAPAAADFRLCNNTGSRVALRSATRTMTAGPPRDGEQSPRAAAKHCCAARWWQGSITFMRRLRPRWRMVGQAFMCTRDKEFTVRGTEECLARGYDRTGFSKSIPGNSNRGRCS